MIILASIVVYLSTSFSLWILTAYLDHRYLITTEEEELPDDEYSLENVGHVIETSIGIGIIAFINLLIKYSKKRFSVKKYSFMIKISKAGKKHGQQDRDLTYQAEKALLDNK